MRVVVTTPTPSPLGLPSSAMVRGQSAGAAQDSLAWSLRRLRYPMRVLMPLFSAEAVPAESGTWALVL